MKQVAIKVTLLILLLSLTLALIACHDDTVDEGDKSTVVTTTDAPSDGEPNGENPNEDGPTFDGMIDFPYVSF